MPDPQQDAADTLLGQEGTIAMYEDLLQRFWNRIQPTLGRVTAIAIMERAQVLAKADYPLVVHLRISMAGVAFDTFRQHAQGQEARVIHHTLLAFINHLIDILGMLTGDILVRQLRHELERRNGA